ncbi:MAG TPA: hypothetical protein VLL72_00535, partial [Kiloniellales bacterium]|nr:hypothetical protein [Kiloniellales bacterium]
MNGSAQNAMHARAPETGDAPARDGEISLAAKVAVLRDPAHYPEPTRSVYPFETHMSWVFLTDRYAYKLKKPVAYDSLDFRSLAARKHFCGEELRLNRRLARNVYVG